MTLEVTIHNIIHNNVTKLPFDLETVDTYNLEQVFKISIVAVDHLRQADMPKFLDCSSTVFKCHAARYVKDGSSEVV